MTNGPPVFGGSWTDQKLGILREYLTSYTTALSRSQFKKGYIDAFAGTGRRESSANAKLRQPDRRQPKSEAQQAHLPDIDLGEAEGEPILHFLDGSARVALQCTPAFDSYVFIEKNPVRRKELERLKDEFPHLAADIYIKLGDANTEIRAMCKKDWTSHRAVLFLDPYGMEVQWKTIEAVAKTKAIDLWVLFPLGGVNRMLTKSGDIPKEWRHRLDELLGTADWYDHFYQVDKSPTLFEGQMDRLIKLRTDVICEYFLKRLRGCFEGVAPNPATLRNTKNSPLYLFCFAAGNPRGAPIALKIASHILKMGS